MQDSIHTPTGTSKNVVKQPEFELLLSEYEEAVSLLEDSGLQTCSIYKKLEKLAESDIPQANAFIKSKIKEMTSEEKVLGVSSLLSNILNQCKYIFRVTESNYNEHSEDTLKKMGIVVFERSTYKDYGQTKTTSVEFSRPIEDELFLVLEAAGDYANNKFRDYYESQTDQKVKDRLNKILIDIAPKIIQASKTVARLNNMLIEELSKYGVNLENMLLPEAEKNQAYSTIQFAVGIVPNSRPKN